MLVEYSPTLYAVKCPQCEEGDLRLGQDSVAHPNGALNELNPTVWGERDSPFILPFSCENHHHFALVLDCHSGATWVEVRIGETCPGPDCWGAGYEQLSG